MKAYELLSDESKWLQNKLSVDRRGYSVEPGDEKAVRWCTLGAIDKCYPTLGDQSEVEEKLRKRVNNSIGFWNDSHTYEEVIAVLKELDI